jgi:pyrroline-5-carboxylate reductase
MPNLAACPGGSDWAKAAFAQSSAKQNRKDLVKIVFITIGYVYGSGSSKINLVSCFLGCSDKYVFGIVKTLAATKVNRIFHICKH